MRRNKRTARFALAAGLMLAVSAVGAHNPGMHGTQGNCPGMGMGGMGMHGMADRCMGMVPGVPGGMGMGVPGGMGMGPRMMGPGMGAAPFTMINLSAEQRTKINAIQDSLRKQQWALQGKINDEEARLRDLYLVEQPDPKKVGQAYSAIFDLRRQMIEAQVQARNQMQNVLTAEQRNQIRQLGNGAPAQGMSPGGAAGGADDAGCLMY